MRLLLLSTLLVAAVQAETTRVWRSSSFEDFAGGRGENVSLRSDGALTLAPRLVELAEAPESYLWDLAVDGDGVVYAAAGPDARVLRVAPDGESDVWFEADAVEVHALATDAEGALYAATGPRGEIYRIDAAGRAVELYNTGAVYVWDLAIGPEGALYAAAGDPGQVHRITADGEGEVHYDAGETHVRSLAFTPAGDLIIGTDPGGLIVRVRDGEDFILYQTNRKEITAVAAAPDGTVYVAGVGKRTAVPAAPAKPTPTPVTVPGGKPQPAKRTSIGSALQVRGGSAIIRLAPGEQPREVWASNRAVVHALGFDDAGKLLIGTGDDGELLRLESPARWTRLVATTSKQVTAVDLRPDGSVVFAASNIGKIFALGPDPADQGWFVSEPFDAERFARWGRLEWDGKGEVEASLRSGNLTRPSRGWSEWGAAEGARFAQWRVELDGASSRVSAVRVFYRPVNEPPEIRKIEVAPPGYRFPPRRAPTSATTLTLPPIGATGAGKRRAAQKPQGPQTLAHAPGWRAVRWLAEDPNDDPMLAAIEIRGVGEHAWATIAEEVPLSEHSWDSTAFPDGRYELRVTVSDAAANTVGEGEATSAVSEPFIIDNSAPALSELTAEAHNGNVRVSFAAQDSASVIEGAEYSADGGDWKAVEPTGGLFDARELEFSFEIPQANVVAVRVRDQAGNLAAAKTTVAP